MSHASSRVYLIVAADFGERLRSLSKDGDAWVADTVTNKPVIKSIWEEMRALGAPSHLNGITSFQILPDHTPEDWLIGILDQVELHHGEHSQSPPYSTLRVVGAVLSSRLKMELEGFGFVRFEDSEDGFTAHKLVAPPYAVANPA